MTNLLLFSVICQAHILFLINGYFVLYFNFGISLQIEHLAKHSIFDSTLTEKITIFYHGGLKDLILLKGFTIYQM